MKPPFFLKAWPMLLGVCYSTSVLAIDTVTPEEPAAYEPLEIIVATPHSGGIYSNYLSVQENTILIGYIDSTIQFTSTNLIGQEISGLPPGDYTVKTIYLPELADGEATINDTDLEFTIADAFPTQQTHAFYHTGTAHFFITADADEAEGLLAESGWEIVDFGFNVWHADDPAPAAAVPVCRFYSAQVNSHFYTGDEAECMLLQEEDHGWEYEGIAFQALVPQDGACLAGTDPVWRAFNNRVAQLDSNHRFVASSDTYRAMIAKGWLGEGVAFCSPPASVD